MIQKAFDSEAFDSFRRDSKLKMSVNFCWWGWYGALRSIHKHLALLKVCNNKVVDLYEPGAPHEHHKATKVKLCTWLQDNENELFIIEDLNFQSIKNANTLQKFSNDMYMHNKQVYRKPLRKFTLYTSELQS